MNKPTIKRVRAEVTLDKQRDKKNGGSLVDIHFKLENGTYFYRRLYLRRPNGCTTIEGSSTELPGLAMYKQIRKALQCPVGSLVGATLMLELEESTNTNQETVMLLVGVSSLIADQQPTKERSLLPIFLGTAILGIAAGYVISTF